jgi:hypothetical protein
VSGAIVVSAGIAAWLPPAPEAVSLLEQPAAKAAPSPSAPRTMESEIRMARMLVDGSRYVNAGAG